MICVLMFAGFLFAIPMYIFACLVFGIVAGMFQGDIYEKFMKSGQLMTFLLIYMAALCTYLIAFT